MGPSIRVTPSAGDSEARWSSRPAAVDVGFHGKIWSSELNEYCLMTVLNAPASVKALPRARHILGAARRRFIPTPAHQEDKTHARGPVSTAHLGQALAHPGQASALWHSPHSGGKPLLRSLRDGQSADKNSRPGGAEREAGSLGLGETAQPVCICGACSRRLICEGRSVAVSKQKGKGCDLKAGLRRAPWAASAQRPCAGRSLTQEEKKCDRLSHRCHFPTQGHL